MITLHKLNNNPDLIRDLLIEKNLEMVEYPVSEWQKLVPTEKKFAYCSGHIMSTNIKIYSVSDKDIFYSILFPDYSDAQIKQLKSLFVLVENIFKKEKSTYKHYNKFMFARNSITAATPSLSIFSNNGQILLNSYSTVSVEPKLPLSNLAFETLYTVILNDFNDKVNAMLNNEKQAINTKNIAHLQAESHEEYIERMHKGHIVKAMKVDVFQKHVDDLNLSLTPIVNDVQNKLLTGNSVSHSMYVMDVYGRNKFLVGIQKINKLKMMLSPLMTENHINKLIQLLSVAQFYSKLMHTDFSNDCIEFDHCDLFNLSKEKLSSNPKYLEFSIGIFDFEISERIKIENYIDDNNSFATLDEAYDYLFNYIQQSICNHLDTDVHSISNQDLLVLDMITC